MNPHLKHLIDLSLILWLDNRNVLNITSPTKLGGRFILRKKCKNLTSKTTVKLILLAFTFIKLEMKTELNENLEWRLLVPSDYKPLSPYKSRFFTYYCLKTLTLFKSLIYID